MGRGKRERGKEKIINDHFKLSRSKLLKACHVLDGNEGGRFSDWYLWNLRGRKTPIPKIRKEGLKES